MSETHGRHGTGPVSNQVSLQRRQFCSTLHLFASTVRCRADPDHVRVNQTDDLHRQPRQTRVWPGQLFRNNLDSPVTHSNRERAGGSMSVRGDIGNDRDRPPCTYDGSRWPDACLASCKNITCRTRRARVRDKVPDVTSKHSVHLLCMPAVYVHE